MSVSAVAGLDPPAAVSVDEYFEAELSGQKNGQRPGEVGDLTRSEANQCRGPNSLNWRSGTVFPAPE